MAKKKQKSVELKDKNITFSLENRDFEVIRFYPSKMTLDVMIFEDKIKQGMQEFPFAHLPRNIKKLVNPN
ncbi:MAG: hypothetical protein P8Y22_06145 [Sulfurimonas sp.]|jgi:hypothetical protein